MCQDILRLYAKAQTIPLVFMVLFHIKPQLLYVVFYLRPVCLQCNTLRCIRLKVKTINLDENWLKCNLINGIELTRYLSSSLTSNIGSCIA